MFLRSADDTGYVDLGLNERCLESGESVDNLTGFIIDADYEGEYNIEFDIDEVGPDERVDDTDIELVAGEGTAPSQG